MLQTALEELTSARLHTIAAILRLESALKTVEANLPGCRQEASAWATMEKEKGSPHFGTAPQCTGCEKSLEECLGWKPLPPA